MDTISRFIKENDAYSDTFVFKLPAYWPSRKYEYHWASTFVSNGDRSLDAACGLCHPLKFYLADHHNDTYACDLDNRILSESAIRNEINEVFGIEVGKNFSSDYFTKIKFEKKSLTHTAYPDNFFNKIYCISVLEHLNDTLNKYPFLIRFKWFQHCLSKDIFDSLKEFKRIVKKGGLLILTFDYPRINLNYLDYCIKKLELNYYGEVDFKLPDNALFSKEHQLYFFRTVLIKP